jgi:hypothetical protein
VTDAATPASSFDQILAESRDLVCARLREALGGMLQKADESLTAMLGNSPSKETLELHQQVKKTLLAEGDKLQTEFHMAYLKDFGRKTSRVKDAGQSFSDLETSLSLVGEEDLEQTLKFKELAARVRRFCDEELAALDQRVGVLLGDANLQAEDNPFGPESICDAYQHACGALDTNMKVRGMLIRLFDDHVVDEVRSIYKAVNALLVKNSILPKIRYGVSKKAEGPKKAGKDGKEMPEEDDEQNKEGAEGEAASEQNLFSMLQKLVGGGGGGGGGVQLPPGTVIIQGAELLGSLTKLQQGDASAMPEGVPALPQGAQAGTVNVLQQLKTSTFGASLQQMDATTLDIVAMIFDQLFDDPNIPPALKGLIGRLQIPMLKVAIADKSFFGNKKHPARQMLDAFGEIAVRLPPEFSSDSAEFMRLEAIVQHVLDNFQDQVGIFDSVREQLRGVIVEEDKKVEEATKAVTEKVEQSETLAVAKTAAEDEIRVRVQAHKLPGAVIEFLVEQWRRFLLVVHARSGGGSAEWKQALEVMDQLVWSVEPKKTAEERRKLVMAVPGLVKQLLAGMQRVGTTPEAKQAFMAELMKYHTENMDAKKAAAPAPEKTAPEPAKPVSLDFSAPVKVANPYGDGKAEVEVVSLDFTPPPPPSATPAERKAAQMSALSVDPPADMEVGIWVLFNSKDEKTGELKRSAKLIFVTPKKTRYVFSDRRGKDMLELSRAEIVRRLRTGEARRLDGEPEEPLFDRIMGGLVDKLKSPAPKPA